MRLWPRPDSRLAHYPKPVRKAITRISRHHERNKAWLARDTRSIDLMRKTRSESIRLTPLILFRFAFQSARLRYHVTQTRAGLNEVGAELARVREMLDKEPTADASPPEKIHKLPLTQFSSLLARIYTPRFHANRIQPAVLDVQALHDNAVRSCETAWRIRWIIARGYIVITWRVLLPLVPVAEFIRSLLEISRR